MERSSELRSAGVVWLAAVAIGGLLSMHALDPTVFAPDGVGDNSPHPSDGTHAGLHGAIGLCVFAFGAAARYRFLPSQSRPVPRAGLDPVPPTSIPSASLPAPGRQRLADLCVLRL